LTTGSNSLPVTVTANNNDGTFDLFSKSDDVSQMLQASFTSSLSLTSMTVDRQSLGAQALSFLSSAGSYVWSSIVGTAAAADNPPPPLNWGVGQNGQVSLSGSLPGGDSEQFTLGSTNSGVLSDGGTSIAFTQAAFASLTQNANGSFTLTGAPNAGFSQGITLDAKGDATITLPNNTSVTGLPGSDIALGANRIRRQSSWESSLPRIGSPVWRGRGRRGVSNRCAREPGAPAAVRGGGNRKFSSPSVCGDGAVTAR